MRSFKISSKEIWHIFWRLEKNSEIKLHILKQKRLPENYEPVTEYEDYNENPAKSYSIDIHEDFWMRNDKLLVDREHLLMALANIDFILIRATNTEGTLDAGYVLGSGVG